MNHFVIGSVSSTVTAKTDKNGLGRLAIGLDRDVTYSVETAR